MRVVGTDFAEIGNAERGLLGSTNSHGVASDHHDATAQVAETVVFEDSGERSDDGVWPGFWRAEHGDARVTARRVEADIAEPAVEGDEEAVVGRSRPRAPRGR